MARPNWEYIRVDVLLPDNPKLDGLSASAKWTLIEMWCYCGQHLTDGFIRDARWKRFGTARDRNAIVMAGLADPSPTGFWMHDYLEHQRSRAEVEELRKKRAESGRKGGQAKAANLASGTANATAFAKQVGKQTSSKSLAEAEAEAEADKSLVDVDDQSPVGDARERLIDLIINELQEATGRTIDRQWAAKTRDYILDGRSPADPGAYIRATIRNDPDPRTRFLPVY